MKRLAKLGLGFLLATSPLVAQQGEHAPHSRLLDTLPLPVRYVRAFGQRLAYYETGPASAPVLVLVPNLAWDAHMFAQNVPALARRYHVIAVDPLGLGRSDKPLVDYKMDTWTDGFAELLRAKGIRSATFVGAVMGGALAVQMALDHPDMVEAIVVAASNSGPGAHEGGARTPPAGPSLAGVRAGLLEAFHDSALVTPEVVRARLAYRLGAGDGYTIQRHLADHRAPYTLEELARVRVPALFVWCREDRTTPLRWGEDYARALPNGKLAALDGCGHLPNMERPEAFDAAVLAFLDANHR
ncbi:putative alpha/beta hydrolase [Gemmatirosa kalamazoonensis]|uniref:Putative alpha/beta hydrolase n=1 Tax=Gemmatirosa kalamazoonensis TaxID=861299 RepID=W0RBZ7_9BACT|nr:alpha/beta hydrolase [Gemmatirosa kalamazoonensis]AHG88629.1 putative alpha/beta hydrolase [Gemmatirosa kalamazoonensis]